VDRDRQAAAQRLGGNGGGALRGGAGRGERRRDGRVRRPAAACGNQRCDTRNRRESKESRQATSER
jgi:hypothetical protein